MAGGCPGALPSAGGLAAMERLRQGKGVGLRETFHAARDEPQVMHMFIPQISESYRGSNFERRRESDLRDCRLGATGRAVWGAGDGSV